MSDCEYILSNGDKMNYDQMRKHLLDNYEKLVSQELKGEKQPLEPEPEPQLKTAPPLTKNGQKARKVFISYLTRETNWDANQRKRIEDNPELYYTPISYEEPTEAAREIIADLGIDEAREYATSQDSSIPAVVKMAILGEVMNYYQKKAKIDEEIEAYNKFERAFEDLAKLGTRYGQAISQLRQIYQLSGLAKVASVNKNIIEDLKRGEGLSQSDIEKQQQEVIDALKKELEGFRDIEKDFEEKLTRLSGIKLSKKAQQAIDGLDDLINSLDKSGRLYDATLGIPIEILKAGLKMIKYSLKIGLTVAEAINEGVIEIKKLLSEKGINFNKEKELRELLNGLPQLVEYQKEEQEQAETPRQREIKPTKKSRIGALDEFVEEVPLSEGNQNYVEEIKKQIIEDNEKVKLGGLLLNRKALRKLIARVLKNEDLDLSDDNVNKEVLEALGWRMSQSQSDIVITLADELKNNREIPPYIAAQYEEIINFIIDLNEGTAINKAINDSVIASMLSSVYNNLVNMLGAGTAVTAMISTILKARSFDALKVAATEFKFAWYEASTILNVKIGYSTIPVELGGKKVSIPESLIPLKLGGGRVSRGASYKDLLEKEAERMKLFGLSAMSSGIGEMSVRTLEYIPHIKNKGFFAYIFTSPVVKSQKVIGRALEAVDTFASAVAAGLTDYYHINRYVNKFYPNATQKEKSALVFDAMYNIRNSDYKKAKLDLIATGISKPQRREIIRTVYERATRARDKKTKELYDKFYDQKRQEAIDYLKKHNLPIDDDQIKLYANLFAGDFNPVVGRGQLQAQRLTGKLDTHGLMATISWFLNVLRGGINKRIREERGVNRVLLQVFDRTVFVLGFPFQASIGRWTEMGLELTPYGLIKGAAYKASAYSKRKINASEAERISDMGNDFMIRSLFGAAVMMLVPVGEGDDDDDVIIQGLEKETDWKQERIQGAGLPKQSIKISEERRYPLLLLGNIGIALTWKADVMKKLKEKREKQEALTEEEQENLAFSITMASAAAAWEIAYTSSWLKTSVDYGKMFSEFDTDKIGTRIGRMMGAHIPYNRLQQEMAQLLDPRSETHKGFAVNVLNQFSIVRAINEGKPNFDHLGREYDYGDIWINSPDGFRKFITGRKYRTELDDYLAEIRFAMSDAIMPKSAEKSNYVIISRPKIEIMNDDEWYDFKKYTADYFRNNLENFYEGKKWKNLTIPEQREAVSQILILSRQAAAAKINGYKDIGDYLYMVKEKKQSFEKDRFLLKDVTKDLSDNFQY